MTEVLVTLTGFGELGGGGAHVLVGFLQAYIFTILTAVYIGLAAHPEH